MHEQLPRLSVSVIDVLPAVTVSTTWSLSPSLPSEHHLTFTAAPLLPSTMMTGAPTGGTFSPGSDDSPVKMPGQQARGSLVSTCALLVGALAVLLSGTVSLSRYPPRSFPRVVVGEEFLQEAGGQFVTLSKGRVHYVLREPTTPSDLPPVVLIHGFSLGCIIWNDVADALVSQGGRRVLAFDLYGRGYSDAAFPCDVELFSGQLTELLFALQPILGPGPIDIFGTSMGGAIAVHFTHLHPERVRRLALLAPAGLPVNVPWTAKLGKLPFFGDIFMPILGPVSLRTYARKGHAYPDDPAFQPTFAAMSRVLRRQSQVNPAFFPALLSTLRDFPLNDLVWAYESVARTRKDGSVLVIWGDRDVITPFMHASRVIDLLGGPAKAKLLVLDDCGHVDPLEVQRNIEEMMPPLLAHLG